MITRIGIGHSQDPQAEFAFKEAAIRAKHQLNLPTSDMVLVFSTDNYPFDQTAFSTIQKILHPKRLICALTTGIILPHGVEPQGVGILAISSDEVRFSPAFQANLNPLSLQETGICLAREAVATLNTPKRQGLIAFLSGLSQSELFLQGLRESLGRSCPIAGGISSGTLEHDRSFIGLDNQLSKNAALCLLIGGTLPVSIATRHSWKPLGRPRLITEAENNIIRTIDGTPALDLYKNYFSGDLKQLSPRHFRTLNLLYPLGVSTDIRKTYLIRHATEILPDGGLACQAEVGSGRTVYMMISDKNSCQDNAHQAALEIREKLNGRPPKMILIFESQARQKLLGRRASHEVTLIKELLGLATPVFGMYTYGEIAPVPNSQNTGFDIHMQSASIVIVAIG